MITPVELQSKNFKSGIGYDKKDVDNFVSELQKNYETMYKENMELNDKINTLNEGINYYKSIEKTLQKALLLAEQAAEDTKEAARKQAKAIEEEASGKASLLISESYKEVLHLKQQTIKLVQQYEAYKAQFKHLAAAQAEMLESEAFSLHIEDMDSLKEVTKVELPKTEVPKTEFQYNTASDMKEEGTLDKSVSAEEEAGFEFYHLTEE
ncbi:cell division initiation protein [Anaerocolumna jejuensis DSM 15929]|uniref:Cell division initiation protein n=1 Tax=Anaerocolumna jejuensis DSM 15929 TaxID=1121322 RepID=A0A1M6JVD1_9FIRM|nr:DivIVA domain-containing protein [Anaerocolumna jejuensis]SHJ50638.1 cell division initiation protein [Anaerocolumna jejuensis DSM 15929]